MDVTLPDGTVIQNVPDGTTKDQLVARLKANGHDTSWYTPPAPEKPSLGQRFMQGVSDIVAAPEVLATLGTGAIGQAVGGIAGGVRAMLPGPEGVGAETSKAVADALTYQPKTSAAKYALGKVGDVMEAANQKLGDVGEAVGGNAGRTIGENALPVAMTVAPVPKLARSFRENPALVLPKRGPSVGFTGEDGTVYSGKDVEFARTNAPKLEAQEIAAKHGIVTDPSLTNPTVLNRAAVSHAGTGEISTKLAIENEPRWNKILAADPDIDIRAPLSLENIAKVRERAAESSGQIAQLGNFSVAENHLRDINALRQKPTIGASNSADQINVRVNEALDLLRNGASASDILTNISQLRKDARKLYAQNDLGPAGNAAAETNIKLANILEDVIDSNLYRMAEENPYGGFKELGDAYRQDRRTMAKSYTLEDAFDANKKQVDPSKIAKMTSADNALTDNFADVGKIAGVFPEIAEIGTRLKPIANVHMSRYGLPGAAGTAIGSLMGTLTGTGAGSGAIVGSLLGASTGEILAHVLRNKVVTPGVQSRAVNPVPRALWDLSEVDPLGPRRQYGDPNIRRDMGGTPPPAGAPGPESPPLLGGPAQFGAPDVYRHPNFQFGDNTPPPVPPMRPEGGPPQLPEFSAEQVMDVVARQRKQEYDAAKGADMRAQAQAEAEAAALRRPAKNGRALGEQSPLAEATVEYANPDALQRAVDKLASGRAFDMTAEERIAWNKATGTIEILRKGTK